MNKRQDPFSFWNVLNVAKKNKFQNIGIETLINLFCFISF